MSWSLITSALASSGPSVAATTAGVNTTGATLLVVAVANDRSAVQATVTDNQSNTWTPLTRKVTAAGGAIQLFYVDSPVTNASHTFTAGAQAAFGMVIAVVAVAGTLAASFDAENGSTTAGSPGNVTNSADGQLLVAATEASTGTPTLSTTTGCLAAVQQSVVVVGGTHFAMALGIGYQTVAAGGVSTFTFTVGTNPSSVIATFKIAPTAAWGLVASPSIVWPGGVARY